MFKLPKLYYGYFIKRYKRFFADISWNDAVITAHNPNTGSMKNLLVEGRKIAFSVSSNPKRKLKYTLEGFFIDGYWVYTNTIGVNKVAEEAIKDGDITEMKDIADFKREYKIYDSKVDFYLSRGKENILLEVKSVSLFDDDYAMFPDAETLRGQKHLKMLMKGVREGYKSCILYIVQSNRSKFKCAEEIDSKYCRLFEEAKKVGVKVLLYRNIMDTSRLTCHLEQLSE